MIKLPGSMKAKKVILAILVVVSIGVIVNETLINRKNITDIDDKQEELVQIGESNSEENNVEENKNQSENEEEERLYNEAYNYFFAGEYSNAINKANEVIEKFPESYKGYNIKGIAESFNVGFDEALSDIDKALALNPGYGYARYNKAFNYELYGKYDEALLWYDKALEVEEYMWSYYGIASIYGRRGDVENTVKYLKKAIEVEGAKEGESGIINEARTEKDFDPVRNSEAFSDLIS